MLQSFMNIDTSSIVIRAMKYFEILFGGFNWNLCHQGKQLLTGFLTCGHFKTGTQTNLYIETASQCYLIIIKIKKNK